MKLTNAFIGLIGVSLLLFGCGTAQNKATNENTTNGSEPQKASEINSIVVGRPDSIIEKMKARGEQDKAEPELQVELPKEGQTLDNSTVKVKIKVIGDLKMGKDGAGAGNHVHVILDNQPYAAHYMWDEGFELRNVSDGEHILRMFASRPWHESYKNEKAFKTIKFTVKGGTSDETKPTTDEKGNKLADAKKPEGIDLEESVAGDVDFTKPLLTYSRPKGEYKGVDAEAIMIDFWLANAKLVGDGGEYRVRYSINNGGSQLVEKWEPFWVKGWKEGKNSVKLELVDKNGKLIENGGYNSTVRIISVLK